MSKSTKRKHVTKEVTDNYVLPSEKQTIVKILGGRGNNLHEVVAADGETYLVSMPTKFRKNVWIKRGDFVLAEPIDEGEKVKAEIAHILYTEQIKYIKSQGKWPEQFNTTEDESVRVASASESDSENNSDNDDDLFVNTNRVCNNYESSAEESESSENNDE